MVYLHELVSRADLYDYYATCTDNNNKNYAVYHKWMFDTNGTPVAMIIS